MNVTQEEKFVVDQSTVTKTAIACLLVGLVIGGFIAFIVGYHVGYGTPISYQRGQLKNGTYMRPERLAEDLGILFVKVEGGGLRVYDIKLSEAAPSSDCFIVFDDKILPCPLEGQ